MKRLNPSEITELRQQMACAKITGDDKLYELCFRALEGRDQRAIRDAKDLCRYIQG